MPARPAQAPRELPGISRHGRAGSEKQVLKPARDANADSHSHGRKTGFALFFKWKAGVGRKGGKEK